MRAASLLPLLLSGCIVRISGEWEEDPVPREACERGDEAAAGSGRGRNCPDIGAACAGFLDGNRGEHLAAIARHDDLTEHGQVHLLDAILGLEVDSSKEEALRSLAGHPGLAPRARENLAARLDELAFDSTRDSVREALVENPPAEAAPL